jgi:hypothetical protein
MNLLQETDTVTVNFLWDIELLRYHEGSYNLKRLVLANVYRLLQ